MEPCGKIKVNVLKTLVISDFNKEDIIIDFDKVKSHLAGCPTCHNYVHELSYRIYSDLKFIRQLILLGLTEEKIFEEFYYDIPESEIYLIDLIELAKQIPTKQNNNHTSAYYRYYLPHEKAVEITGTEGKSIGIQTHEDIKYYEDQFGI